MKNSKKIVTVGISLLVLIIVFGIYFVTISDRIKITSPVGGDVLQMGENVLVKWEGGPKDAPEVFVYLVPNTRKQCKAFTTNGSMATCRFWPIYNGENKGQFTWLVGSQSHPFHELETGRYRLWITTDHKDYSKESFSDFITIAENEAVVSENIAEWKTYTNNELGFEFKYPAKSFVQFYIDRNTVVLEDVGKTKYGFTIAIVDQDKYRAPSVSHSKYVYDYNRATNTFTATDITGSPTFLGKCPEVFSLNKIPFYVSYQSGYYTAGGNDDSSYILLTNKDKTLIINFNDQGMGTNPILSTFKLIGDTQVKQASCVK